MQSISQKIRTALLMAALAVAAFAFTAGDATAERPCTYYCGDPGEALCFNAPAKLGCTTQYP